MLQLDGTSALEGGNIAIGSESNWIPESDRVLHAELALECTKRGSGVVGPVTPGASGQAILLSCLHRETQSGGYTMHA